LATKCCLRSSEFVVHLGLYYYKARFYAPQLGRFLQTDPVGGADDLNLYAYVGNNPINFTDPSGLAAAAAKPFNYTPLGSATAFAYTPVGFGSGAQVAMGPLLPLLGLGLIANEIATSDVPMIGGSLAKGVAAGAKEVGLTATQLKNVERFTQKLPANAKDSVGLRSLPNEGVAAQATSPGRVPGSSAVYEKQIDSTGKTIQYPKTTYDPAGNIVHVKDKIDGGVFP
jgi:RHS repeat-associated protein